MESVYVRLRPSAPLSHPSSAGSASCLFSSSCARGVTRGSGVAAARAARLVVRARADFMILFSICQWRMDNCWI
jgi:hypothetical protein